MSSVCDVSLVTLTSFSLLLLQNNRSAMLVLVQTEIWSMPRLCIIIGLLFMCGAYRPMLKVWVHGLLLTNVGFANSNSSIDEVLHSPRLLGNGEISSDGK